MVVDLTAFLVRVARDRTFPMIPNRQSGKSIYPCEICQSLIRKRILSKTDGSMIIGVQSVELSVLFPVRKVML